MYLAKGASGSEVQHSMDDTFYVLAILGHMAATVYLMFRVVEQMLNPWEDPVRASLPGGRIWRTGNAGQGHVAAAARLESLGFDPSEARRLPVDDPLGGLYDDAPDRAPWLLQAHAPVR
ncbi:hypothetical protein ACFFX0_16995 [Citricoccus parietis]